MNTDNSFLAGGYGGTSPIQSFVCLPLIDHEWSSMDVTKTHKKSRKLSLKQRNAVDLLVQGRTDQEVANLLQIRRETVNRWKNSCPFFRSALNKKRKEVWENAHMRLRSLITNATDTLEQRIDQGNWRAAVELLKILGLKGKVPPPSETVDPLLVLLEQSKEWAWLEMQKRGPSEDLFSDLLENDSHYAKLVRQRMDELLKEHGLL